MLAARIDFDRFNNHAPAEPELRLPPHLAERVDAYARRHGIPLPFAQRCLILAGLEAEEAARPGAEAW